MIARKPAEVRVRMAPSPTGYLHIGTARAALFNWLFARKNSGVFILRIEDTDKQRSRPEYEEDILSGLKWLGLGVDEGPIRQSERLSIYEKYLQKLLADSRAYYCFCTKEELELSRQSQLTSGQAPIYSGRCRSLTAQEIKKKQGQGEKSVIRFKVPAKKIIFNDLIRGRLEFDGALLGDLVIARSLREPLYNFSATVDDYEMKISHVIRGEDHLANTPKQIALFEALNLEPPIYAHLPLILNSDRSKMSKRFGATSLRQYRRAGYLPEAMLNFLVLLGWHPAGDEEILTGAQMTSQFDLSRVQKAGAIFNVEKLDWINAQYLKKLNDKELLNKLIESGAVPTEHNLAKAQLLAVVALTKERLKRLADFKEFADFFFSLPAYDPKMLIWKKTPAGKILENLELARKIVGELREGDFNEKKLENILMPIAERQGRGEFLWPLRVALSGKDASPGPIEILAILGKKQGLERLKAAVEKLNFQAPLY